MWYFTFGEGHSITFIWDKVLPVWVPLGGALGGCFVSLVGTAMHTADWDSSRFGYWHILRPLLGMLSGSVAVLMLLFVLKGVAPDVIPRSSSGYTASGVAVLFVLAFVVGYREETFRDLVRKVVDMMLGPSDSQAASKVVIVPSLIEMVGSEDPAQSPAKAQVTLYNGTADTYALTNPQVVGCKPDGALTASIQTPGTALAPSDLRTLDLTWDYANHPGPMTASLTVNVGGNVVTASVRGAIV
jgi:hypothetical protein